MSHKLICGNSDPTDLSNDQYKNVLNILRIIDMLPTEEFGEFLDMVSLSTASDQFITAVRDMAWETPDLLDNFEKLGICESDLALMTENSNGLSVLQFTSMLLPRTENTSSVIPVFLEAKTRGKSINANIGPKYVDGPIQTEEIGRDLWVFLKGPYALLKSVTPARLNVAQRLAWWKEWKITNRMWISYYDALVSLPQEIDLTKLREFWKHLSAGQFIILYAALTLFPILLTLIGLPFMSEDVRQQELEQMTAVLLFCSKFVLLTLGPPIGFLQSLEVVRRLAAPETPGMVISRWRRNKKEIGSLFNETKTSVELALKETFAQAMGPSPLQFMKMITFDIYLPAITTNWRAETIQWEEIVRFINGEYKKSQASALDVDVHVSWFHKGMKSLMHQFYNQSEIISRLELTFWRLPGANNYDPSPLYMSTAKHPRPFNPEGRSRSPTRPQ